MRERLRASDVRFLAVCLVLLGITIWFSVRNFYRAFPEASIDFRVSRDEGRAIARTLLNGQNYSVETYRQAASFSFDDTAKTFLEREAGLEQANRIMGTSVRLWRWSYRWFRPEQKEEFRVDVTTRGEVAGFEHLVPENAARPDAGSNGARALVEDFLRSRMRRDPAALEFVESSEVARPHRIDRVLTWKDRDFSLNDATGRIEVTVLGNEVAGYREFLVMLVGMLAVIVMRVRHQDVRWRTAAIVGLIGMALSFFANLNELPLSEFSYPTTDPHSVGIQHRSRVPDGQPCDGEGRLHRGRWSGGGQRHAFHWIGLCGISERSARKRAAGVRSVVFYRRRRS